MSNRKIIIVGGSAGSLGVVLKLLPVLKADYAVPVIIVFHRKASDDSTLVNLLRERSQFDVKEAEDKEVIQDNVVYIAPADYHLLVEKDFTLSLDFSEKVNHSRPSIDVTFEAVADVYGDRAAGILLSGANGDGAEGLYAIKQRGGIAVIQDPNHAEVPYMPQYALKRVKADYLLNDDNLEKVVEVLVGK